MPVDMNKTIAEASLDNLHDIIVPEAVGFFPLAPGWTIVLLLLLALLFHTLVKAYTRYKRSLYRREALEELGKYREHSKKNASSVLLLAKRVGIAAYGREVIAKLYDDTWWDFMEKHSKAKVSPEARRDIAKLLYDESYTMNPELQENIITFVTLWIKTHKGKSDV